MNVTIDTKKNQNIIEECFQSFCSVEDEKAQKVRLLDALPEDLGFNPRTCMLAHNSLWLHSQGIQCPLLTSMGTVWA